MAYEQGDLVRCSAAFTNAAGSPTDPTTVTFRWVSKSGTVTTQVYGDGVVIRDSTGNFHCDVTVPSDGLVSYQFAGTGAVQRTVTNVFAVTKTAFSS